MAYQIQNNTPVSGAIQWSGVHMQYQGASYAVADGYTNYKFVYWLLANPAVFYVSDTFPNLGSVDALVFLNKSGIAMVVPSATVLDGGLIVPGSIYADAIAANTITSHQIAAGAITATELAVDAVTAGAIAANAIGAGAIAAGAIQADHIQGASITGDKLVVDTITAREIAARTITANEIATNTITAGSGIIADAAITTAKIASVAVTNAQIADATIQSAKIAAIDAGKITTGTLDAARIAAGAITVGKLENAAQRDISTARWLAQVSMGKLILPDATFRLGANGVNLYNNASNGLVAVARIAKPADCPTTSGSSIRITHTGAGSPGFGGFVQDIQSRANAVFIIKYLIKLPVGYSLNAASNVMGTGYTDVWLTDTGGTGMWKEYIRKVECGASGTFSGGGHVYVSGSPTPSVSVPLVWYLGAIYLYDVTDTSSEASLAAWSYNNDITYIDGGKIYTGSLTADKITAGTLQSAGGASWINLANGQFSFGSGALAWNGSLLSAKGTFETVGTTQSAKMDGGSVRLINSGVELGYFSIQTATPDGPYVTVAQAGTAFHIAKVNAGFLYSALDVGWASAASSYADYITLSANRLYMGENGNGYLLWQDGNLYLTKGNGKGVYVTDETTGREWHLHMHGDSLKYLSSGYAEFEVIDTRNKDWYNVSTGLGGINRDISGSNIHSDYNTGFYMGANVANAYTADWYYFLVQRHNSAYKTIISIPLSTTGLVRWKSCRNGSWGSWYQINA